MSFSHSPFIIISLDCSLKKMLVELYQHSPSHQVVFSSLLGALPGCGGAIIVTTQFVSGKVGFGSVVAVLTATMGDAAFLILASKPSIGFGLIAVGVVVGIVTGLIVNAIHKPDFLRPKLTEFVQTLTPKSARTLSDTQAMPIEQSSTFDTQCRCSKNEDAPLQNHPFQSSPVQQWRSTFKDYFGNG